MQVTAPYAHAQAGKHGTIDFSTTILEERLTEVMWRVVSLM